jgi:hypothetical protein
MEVIRPGCGIDENQGDQNDDDEGSDFEHDYSPWIG